MTTLVRVQRVSSLPEAQIDDALMLVTDKPGEGVRKTTVGGLRASISASPVLTGTPTAPTPPVDASATRVQTAGGVRAEIADKAPAAPWVQPAGDGQVARRTRTLGDKLYETVSYLDFLRGGMTDVEAINAAMDYVWRNNNQKAPGVVLVPAGPRISMTAPIVPRPGVTLRGDNRHLYLPSWTWTSSVGMFNIEVSDCAIEGFLCDGGSAQTEGGEDEQRAGIVITNNARNVSLRRLRLLSMRSIYVRSGGGIRIHDVEARRGTGLFGLGIRDSGDVPEDIILTAVQAYDMKAEAIDIGGDGVRGFELQGFQFRRCSLGEGLVGQPVGQIIDIGGRDTDGVTIGYGLVDTGGEITATVEGLWVKDGPRNVQLSNIKFRGGVPTRSNNRAIHLSESYNTDITDCDVDASFGRGLFVEIAAQDFHLRGGKCGSPIVIYGTRGSVDVTHDGAGTTSTAPAILMGGAMRDVQVRGTVRNRPSASAVSIIAGAVNCGVKNMDIQGCLRGVQIGGGTARCYAEDIRANGVTGNVVIVETGALAPRALNIQSVNNGSTSAGNIPVVSLAGNCNGAHIDNIRSTDTRDGTERTAGRALTVTGASHSVIIGTTVVDNIPLSGSTSGTNPLANSRVTDGFTVTAPAVDTQLIAPGVLAAGVVVSRASTALRRTVTGTYAIVATNQPRFDGPDQYLLAEEPATRNIVAPRDLTDAAWVKTNMLVERIAQGIDGADNAASLITATADNATVIQSLTLTSAARTGYGFVRRAVGSGAVSITMDSGATWTPISIGDDFGRALRAQTLANPGFGFRLATAGDAIIVDYCDVETRSFATSPVPDSIAARAAESVRWTIPGIWPNAFTIHAEFDVADRYTNMGLMGFTSSSSANRIRLLVNSSNQLQMLVTLASVTTTLTLGTLPVGRVKVSVVITTSYISALMEGGTVQRWEGAMPTQITGYFADAVAAGTTALRGLTRRVDGLVTAISDASLPAAQAAW